MNILTGRRAAWIYEAARLECIASNRPIIPEMWLDRDEPFRAQFHKTVERVCADGYETTPEAEHDSWHQAYKDMGWCYGPERSTTAKTHPDMVPFDQLSLLEQEKDQVFLDLCVFAHKWIR